MQAQQLRTRASSLPGCDELRTAARIFEGSEFTTDPSTHRRHPEARRSYQPGEGSHVGLLCLSRKKPLNLFVFQQPRSSPLADNSLLLLVWRFLAPFAR